jgi:hypothetical protein
VWRLRTRPEDNKLAVAAMRGHYHVLEMGEAELRPYCHYTKVNRDEFFFFFF